jgi:hypothetical protein
LDLTKNQQPLRYFALRSRQYLLCNSFLPPV